MASEGTLRYEPTTSDYDYLIFFIPGNPGLISYYGPFLSTLSSLLAEEGVATCVYGHALAGFEAPSGPPVGLLDQILRTENVLHAFVDARRRADSRNRTKAILVGHSVGAYILLEIVRRHRSSAGGSRGNVDIIGGILLFPTVVDIAKSALGLRFAVGHLLLIFPNPIYNIIQGILRLPTFALVISTLVYLSVLPIPTTALYRLVKLITGYPEHAARTSTKFIKSRMGVRQTL
ncbi:MAG: hypothetical protein M1813_006606 [Trichoglossum hirsutum]|nr:MAG: hypothetical protein M1813_006606 [Trichoglossum hirsutum]